MTPLRQTRCLGVVLVLSLTLACGKDAGYYVEKGKRLRAQGKFEEAALNFQKALQKDPRNGAAYLELGGVSVQRKDGAAAYRALYQAVELLPESHEAKKELADVCLAGYLSDPSRPKKLYSQIAEISRQFLAADPDSFDGHRLQGYLGILDRRPEQALEHLRRANEIQPGEPHVTQALTQVLFELHEPGEAEELALRLVEKRKDFGPIYDILYRYYESSQRAAEAERTIRSKVENNPGNASFALQLAAHYSRMNKRKEMEATLQRLLDAPRKFPDARLQVGDFYLAIGQPDQARRYYEQGVQSGGAGAIAYQKRLVMLLVSERRGSQGLPILDRILQIKPDDVPARAIRASLLLESPKAADRERSVMEFEGLVAKNPADADLRYGYGGALGATGKPELARRQFVEAVRLRPGAAPARLALGEMALRRKDYREALKVADELLQLRPGDPRARLIRAKGLRGTGAFAEASAELKRLSKTAPDFAAARFELGLVYLDQGKFAEAEAVFRAFGQRGPGNRRAAEGLSQVYLRRNLPQKAIEVWKREVEREPDPGARLALAAVAVKARQYQTAIDQYQALAATDPASGSVRQMLAFAQELRGDDAAAIASLRKAVELDPNDAHAPMTLGQLLDKAGSPQEAAAYYRRVIQLQPNDAQAMNNLAFALSETGGSLDEALRLALRAQNLMAGQANVADTIGWIYVKQNLPDSALRIFTMLVRKNPDTPTYRYHLGAALLLKGDKAAAKVELETALKKSPGKLEARKISELLKILEGPGRSLL